MNREPGVNSGGPLVMRARISACVFGSYALVSWSLYSRSPERCMRRCSMVMASKRASSSGIHARTFSSVRTFPASTRRMIAAAVNCFVTEAIW